jgi:SAM-dependent methyltransferase
MIPFSKLCDAQDWSDKDLNNIIRNVLKEEPSYHRKQWEFAIIYGALNSLGYLRANKTGLGLGVGHECLLRLFANKCKEIVGIDKYDQHSSWEEARFDIQEIQSGIPNLEIRNQDMRDLSNFKDESFDFVWSSCSIEHVDSVVELCEIFQHVHRILKPNGVFAFTSEYTLPAPDGSDIEWYKPNLISFNEGLIDFILNFSGHPIKSCETCGSDIMSGFKVVGDRTTYVSSHPDNRIVPHTCFRPHIRIMIPEIPPLTSFSLVLRKHSEIIYKFGSTLQ